MVYEYHGFTVHRMGPCRFYVTGYGFQCFTASITEAANLISGYLAAQCTY